MHEAYRTREAGLMVRLSLFLLTSVVFLASVGHALVSAQAKPPGKTVWDGVYTDAQAERATAVFSSTCSRCHTLGADGHRPLSGDKFWEGFTQKSVTDLLTFVSKNMPNGQGGTLSAATSSTASGAGHGGTITVNANQIQVNSGGLITAATTGADVPSERVPAACWIDLTMFT